MLITFYGASDDLVEVGGCGGAGEFNHYSNAPWTCDLVAPDGTSMQVHLFYDGTWHVGVGQVDEDEPLPPWPLAFASGPDDRPWVPKYSTALTVDAPEGTRLKNARTA